MGEEAEECADDGVDSGLCVFAEVEVVGKVQEECCADDEHHYVNGFCCEGDECFHGFTGIVQGGVFVYSTYFLISVQ